MKTNSIIMVGCGDLGLRTGLLLGERGYSVAGVCRTPDRLPSGVHGYAADYTQRGSLAFLAGLEPEVVLATFKPTAFSPEGYLQGFPVAMSNLLDGLGDFRPRLVVMVSSTRVFAERDGGWVDESSALDQESYAASAIVAAEQLLSRSIHDSCIVRFGGIYGDPSGRLLTRIARGELCAPAPERYSNRIHREDCAGLLAHLVALEAGARQPVYIGVDDEPAPQYEVESWLAEQLGVAIDASAPIAASRGDGHKRCRNRLLHDSGYRLLYPDYRVGYAQVLAAAP